DFSLFTARAALGADLAQMFNALTGFSKVTDYDDLLVAPVTLRREILAAIDRETEHAEAGRPCGIRAKLNAVTDKEVVQALYRASQAGVPIDLLVRGMCTLRPGVPGLSETIRVRSIVGRFLEHSRVFVFVDGGSRKLFIGSADWMGRNLDRRVEIAVPIDDQALAELLDDTVLATLFADNLQSRELLSDGSYRRLMPESGSGLSAQKVFLQRLDPSTRGTR
ncbi:MAG TPA: phospholipase D-like domain-containing protein, partial [Candidatus Dormibacteraeota bacterium]|nr:phospholipase D-like domain-containing protein [Candidatus Dormibacteraeota bacterium]